MRRRDASLLGFTLVLAMSASSWAAPLGKRLEMHGEPERAVVKKKGKPPRHHLLEADGARFTDALGPVVPEAVIARLGPPIGGRHG